MNDLARPAMYEARHEILPLEEHKDAPIKEYDVVGPVCESTDTFGKAYRLPALEAGDKIVFLSAGAYGSCMSSEYNSRPFIAEIAVMSGKAHIIRAAQSVDSMLARERFVDE